MLPRGLIQCIMYCYLHHLRVLAMNRKLGVLQDFFFYPKLIGHIFEKKLFNFGFQRSCCDRRLKAVDKHLRIQAFHNFLKYRMAKKEWTSYWIRFFMCSIMPQTMRENTKNAYFFTTIRGFLSYNSPCTYLHMNKKSEMIEAQIEKNCLQY